MYALFRLAQHYYFFQRDIFQLKTIIIRPSLRYFKIQGKMLLFARTLKNYKIYISQ